MWTMAQQEWQQQWHKEHTVKGVDHPVWKPVTHTSRSKTKAEMNYGKVDGESLAVLSGIHSNKMYLYGTKFTVVVDHEPLVPMYNGHSISLPFRVAKHKSKLRGFDFQLRYEPGVTTPADYGSRQGSSRTHIQQCSWNEKISALKGRRKMPKSLSIVSMK